MSNAEIIRGIEATTRYTAVRIDRDGNITGRPADEPIRYNPRTNTGGRRYLGNRNSAVDMAGLGL